MTRRWCLPGGHLDSRESAAKGCAREAREEPGLEIEALSRVWDYSSPDLQIAHQRGNRVQFVSPCDAGRNPVRLFATCSETTLADSENPGAMESLMAWVSDGDEQKEDPFVR